MKLTSSIVAFLLPAGVICLANIQSQQSYRIVGTGQTLCFDNFAAIDAPKPGDLLYGQDAQHPGNKADYTLSKDGLTVRDGVAGLTWQRSPDTNGDGTIDRRDKLTFAQAVAQPAKLNAAKFGGFTDWRLPTIKELYSLIQFSGVDPSGPISGGMALTPFIDERYFKFAYGDPNQGERIIDSQYASSTKYVGRSAEDKGKLFGVNFADGRIKGYDLVMPGRGEEKTFFVICVRGNPAYGKNDFHDNGDGTVEDKATGLTWCKSDSRGMNWGAALQWVHANNARKFLGHDDWRLPNAKELQSIVDYTRAPDATGSPAIDPVFNCTQIVNEAGQQDYPFYWTSTTHASGAGGANAVYIAFGRASGWLSGPPAGPPSGPGGKGKPGGGLPQIGPRGGVQGKGNPPNPNGPPPRGSNPPRYTDVHGAGAQRSDPKIGDPRDYPHGRGPQGDVVRIYNFVRMVRGG